MGSFYKIVLKMTALEPVYYNVQKWIENNEQYFLPPVCNKMMHNTQLKVFYVGGPNQRKDYHLEEGEELFFMRKGDMCLKILEQNKFKDVEIKEGQVFLLPGKIPHSPQRNDKTVGLVIERERLLTETDGLRYFVEDGSTNSLFERWFYCDDLGTQLGPVIREFFASKQFKTGKPIPDDMPKHIPWTPNSSRKVEEPFDLMAWVDRHADDLKQTGSVPLFDPSLYQSDVYVHGSGDQGMRFKAKSEHSETIFWVLRGSVCLDDGKTKRHLRFDDTLLMPKNSNIIFEYMSSDSAVLSTTMNPKNKSRITPF